MYRLQFDGLFRKVNDDDAAGGKAGFMGYGWLIYRNEILAARGHGVYARCREAGSLIAEYLALIEGLEALLDLGVRTERVIITGDAKSIFDQMLGVSGVNAPSLKPLYRRARRLALNLRRVDWVWMPRCENRDADRLTRLAMRQVKVDRVSYEKALSDLQLGEAQPYGSKRLISLLDLRIYQPMPAWMERAIAVSLPLNRSLVVHS